MGRRHSQLHVDQSRQNRFLALDFTSLRGDFKVVVFHWGNICAGEFPERFRFKESVFYYA